MSSFSFLPTTDTINEEDEVPAITRSSPKFCPSPSINTLNLETPVENRHNEVRPRPVARSDPRRVGRDRRRRTSLRRQSSSPGPSPRLISLSHFTNDLSPPQVEDFTAAVTATMAAVNMDEMTDRLLREEEESLALARMLMAEEAMESYARSADFLQQNAQFYSPEDLEALQAVLQDDGDDGSTTEDDLSYDTMLRLGERIGDVKSERWAIIARDEINKLDEFTYNSTNINNNRDDSTVKCLVCQFSYASNEKLRKLPCGHCFHSDCVGSWLMEKDSCPYCRQPLIPNHDY